MEAPRAGLLLVQRRKFGVTSPTTPALMTGLLVLRRGLATAADARQSVPHDPIRTRSGESRGRGRAIFGFRPGQEDLLFGPLFQRRQTTMAIGEGETNFMVTTSRCAQIFGGVAEGQKRVVQRTQTDAPRLQIPVVAVLGIIAGKPDVREVDPTEHPDEIGKFAQSGSRNHENFVGDPPKRMAVPVPDGFLRRVGVSENIAEEARHIVVEETVVPDHEDEVGQELVFVEHRVHQPISRVQLLQVVLKFLGVAVDERLGRKRNGGKNIYGRE